MDNPQLFFQIKPAIPPGNDITSEPSRQVLKSVLQGLQNRKSLPTQMVKTCL